MDINTFKKWAKMLMEKHFRVGDFAVAGDYVQWDLFQHEREDYYDADAAKEALRDNGDVLYGLRDFLYPRRRMKKGGNRKWR